MHFLQELYGWLMDLINLFGNQGGFDLIVGRFTSGEELDAGQMAALLLPLGQCAKFLVKEVVCPILLPAVNKALLYVANLDEKQLKGQVDFQTLLDSQITGKVLFDLILHFVFMGIVTEGLNFQHCVVVWSLFVRLVT